MTINDLIERLRWVADHNTAISDDIEDLLFKAADALTAAADREKGLRVALENAIGAIGYVVQFGSPCFDAAEMADIAGRGEAARKALLAGVEAAQ